LTSLKLQYCFSFARFVFVDNQELNVNKEQKRKNFFNDLATIATKATLEATLLRSHKYFLNLYLFREYQVFRILFQSSKTIVINKNENYNSLFISNYI